MQLFSLCVPVVLTYFMNFSSANPLTTDDSTPSLSTRSQYCYNAPLTVAGSPLESRNLAPSPSSLQPRASPGLPSPIVWCVPGGSTYLMILMKSRMPGIAILQFLNDAYNLITDHISNAGDGVISGGAFNLEVNGIGMSTINTNNHQQTYGVLAAAVEGLSHYFYNNQDAFGAVYFYIFDGANEVGQGQLGPM